MYNNTTYAHTKYQNNRWDVIAFSGVFHIIFAQFIYILLYPFNMDAFVGIIIGSLLPDIDTPHSILGRYNLFVGGMKHRGFTHTILSMIIFTWAIKSMFSHVAAGFLFGYAMHLIMDGLTPMGIMWMFPFKLKYYSLWKNKKPSRN